MKKLTLSIGTCLLLMSAGVQNAGAQTLNFGDAVAQWSQACAADIDAHCKGINPGGGRLNQCIQANASLQCKQATAAFQMNMDARFAAQSAAPEMCRGSVKRLCSNFKEGQARVLRCLMRRENFRKADSRCKDALANAGWLDEISIRNQ
jgi:hypothetical protein